MLLVRLSLGGNISLSGGWCYLEISLLLPLKRLLCIMSSHCQQGLKEGAPLHKAWVISSADVPRSTTIKPVLSGAPKVIMVSTRWGDHSSILQLYGIIRESCFRLCLFCNVTWVETKILSQIALNRDRNWTNACFVDLTECLHGTLTLQQSQEEIEFCH